MYLVCAWICLGVVLFTIGLLLDDLKKEMQYNNACGDKNVTEERVIVYEQRRNKEALYHLYSGNTEEILGCGPQTQTAGHYKVYGA